MAFLLSKALKKHSKFLIPAFPANPAKSIQTPTHPSSSFSAGASATLPPPPHQASEGEQRSRLSRWLLFLPGAITFGLGTWQIFRRQEKVDLIDYRRKRLELEPLLLNDLVPLNGDLKSLEFRRVECHGIFNERESVYVGPRSRSISGVTENGYYVVTPLMLTTGNPGSVQPSVLVNRGWVPCSWRDKDLGEPQDAKKPSNVTPEDVQDKEGSSWWKFWSKKAKVIKMGLEHGNQTDQDQDQEPTVIPVKVVGVVRGSEKPSIFVPANDPSSGQWFYVDVPAIAQAVRLPENTIYIEDINDNVNPSQPYPVPKDVDSLVRYSVMPQDHLNYTFTWYSLSAAVTYMAFKRLKLKKSRR